MTDNDIAVACRYAGACAEFDTAMAERRPSRR
jgi:hypothetical protein